MKSPFWTPKSNFSHSHTSLFFFVPLHPCLGRFSSLISEWPYPFVCQGFWILPVYSLVFFFVLCTQVPPTFERAAFSLGFADFPCPPFSRTHLVPARFFFFYVTAVCALNSFFLSVFLGPVCFYATRFDRFAVFFLLKANLAGKRFWSFWSCHFPLLLSPC